MVLPPGLADVQLAANSLDRWREMEASVRGLESIWRRVGKLDHPFTTDDA